MDFDEFLATGREIATQLVGLTVEQARAVAANYPDYQIDFVAEGSAITADLRANRVRAFVLDGSVIRASAG